MSARKLGLLALVLGFGLTIEAAHEARAHLSLGPSGCRILTGRFQGPSFSFDEASRPLDLGETTWVEVTNAFGSVSVEPATGEAASASLRSVVYRPTREEAEEFAAGIRLQTNTAGDALRVSTNREAIERREDVGFETHLSLRVPAHVRVRVRNEHGAIRIEGVAEADADGSFDPIELRAIAGPAEVRGRHGDTRVSGVDGTLHVATQHGDVELDTVGGETQVEVAHGDATLRDVGSVKLELRHGRVKLEDVRGNAVVKAEHARLQVDRITGWADLETSYEPILLHDVAGNVRAASSHGRVTASRIGGDVDVEVSYDDVVLDEVTGRVEARVTHGGIKGTRLQGGVRAVVSGDDVVLEDFAGLVDVESRRGSVQLRSTSAPEDDMSVSATTGDVRVALPRGAPLALEALAPRGTVRVELADITLSESGEHRLVGHIGSGGPTLQLRSERGNVRVTETD